MSTIEKAINKLINSAAGNGAVVPPASPPPTAPNQGGKESVEVISSGIAGDRYVELNVATLASAGMVTPDAPVGMIEEEFRHIKRPLINNLKQADGARTNMILVTSSISGEGKTFTSANLAMSIAKELDKTVLLIDADATKSGIAEIFNFDPGEGLTDILVNGETDLSKFMIKTNIPKLSILSSGGRYGNVTELFSSQVMLDLFAEIASRYRDRVIVIDAPPILETSEARVLASLVGQVVMVVEAEKTPRSLVQEAVDQLDKSKITGLVLNKTLRSIHGGYGGYHTYGGGYGGSRK